MASSDTVTVTDTDTVVGTVPAPGVKTKTSKARKTPKTPKAETPVETVAPVETEAVAPIETVTAPDGPEWGKFVSVLSQVVNAVAALGEVLPADREGFAREYTTALRTDKVETAPASIRKASVAIADLPALTPDDLFTILCEANQIKRNRAQHASTAYKTTPSLRGRTDRVKVPRASK